MSDTKKKEESFDDFLKSLEEGPQPVCNIQDPENCESCSG